MVHPENSHGVSRVVHHKDFYLRGGDMTVLVENHLYRIHSYFFHRESLFFRTKFGSANTGEDAELGSNDSNHYTLDDVKSEDFERFLWVFYNPKYSVYKAPLETWLSILKLANRWTFDNVKELAVTELEKIDIEAVEKISIYHDNTISRLYLIPSYIAVCKRDKPLSFTEGMKLGMETVLRIAEARERLRLQASESGIRTPTFEDFEDAEVEVLIREIFCLGSRPTSPHSAAASAPGGTNGSANGTIKLNPAPSGTHAKANGGSRATGGSATDPKVSSVDPMPSFAAMGLQAKAMGSDRTSTPLMANPVTGAESTGSRKPLATGPAASPAETPSQPPPPPPDSAKPKDNKEKASQETSSLYSLLSPLSGVGEPSSSAETKEEAQAGSEDLISKPVVPSKEHNNDDSSNVNDEKDESGKDNDAWGLFSDSESVRGGKQGQKSKRGKGAKGPKKP